MASDRGQIQITRSDLQTEKKRGISVKGYLVNRVYGLAFFVPLGDFSKVSNVTLDTQTLDVSHHSANCRDCDDANGVAAVLQGGLKLREAAVHLVLVRRV